ncbi:MAG TPA: peptidoglycan-associated lipoprotein Pal [Candidatus Binatia bacterium]|jgi:peptidoglycan-associated lipoprotein|nr:peptidoglycan-associated lipoprotein Pal [Candidatus Binatia bacterium]
MKLKLRQLFSLKVILAVAFLLLVSACHKKQPPAPTPAAPPPPAPKAMLTANPNTITAGQATTLTWSTDFATDVSIDGIGKVDLSGSTKVTPAESTTYRLVAKNDSGTQEATARVTVNPAPPPTTGKTTTESDAQLFQQNMKDIFYAYDSYELTMESEATIQGNAKFLQQHPNMTFTIEGHCDERGSIEYNLTLGEYRANAAKQALTQQGVSATRMRTISYGKEKPFCTESTEACWQQNRRAHFVYSK